MDWDEFVGAVLGRTFTVTVDVPPAVPNTFRSNPQPREGFIDARRDDGCVPVITELVV